MVINGGLTWGSEHTMQCTDGVLWNCAPKTCTTVLTGVTPTNEKKGKKDIST